MAGRRGHVRDDEPSLSRRHAAADPRHVAAAAAVAVAIAIVIVVLRAGRSEEDKNGEPCRMARAVVRVKH